VEDPDPVVLENIHFYSHFGVKPYIDDDLVDFYFIINHNTTDFGDISKMQIPEGKNVHITHRLNYGFDLCGHKELLTSLNKVCSISKNVCIHVISCSLVLPLTCAFTFRRARFSNTSMWWCLIPQQRALSLPHITSFLGGWHILMPCFPTYQL